MPKLGADLSRTIIEAQQAAEGSKGKLLLGVLDGLPLSESIREIMDVFRDNMEFELLPVCLSMEDGVKAIHDGEIDMLYAHDSNSTIDENLDRVELFTDQFSMAVSSRSQFANLDSAYLQEFSHEKFFVSGSETSFELHRWRDTCASLGFMPRFVNVVNPATQILCVEQNLGVCILPSTHQAFEHLNIHRVALLDHFTMTVNLKWNKVNHNPCIPVFLNMLSRHKNNSHVSDSV